MKLRLNDGTEIECHDVKFENRDSDLNPDFIVASSIPFEARSYTAFYEEEDEYQAELNHIDEQIRFSRDEINSLKRRIEILRTDIQNLEDEKYRVMNLIEKREMTGKREEQ